MEEDFVLDSDLAVNVPGTPRSFDLDIPEPKLPYVEPTHSHKKAAQNHRHTKSHNHRSHTHRDKDDGCRKCRSHHGCSC